MLSGCEVFCLLGKTQLNKGAFIILSKLLVQTNEGHTISLETPTAPTLSKVLQKGSNF